MESTRGAGCISLAVRTVLALMVMLLIGVAFGEEVLDTPSGRPISLVKGPVDGTKCEVEAVQRANSAQLHSILEELANTTYFRLVRVAMDDDCPFTWGDKNKDEVTCGSTPPGGPAAAFGFGSSLSSPGGGASLCSIEPTGNEVNPFISDTESSVIEDEFDDDMDSDDDDVSLRPDFWFDICRPPRAGSQLDYVNLVLNPEQNTGYNGSHIWEAIDAENCVSIGRGLGGGSGGYCYEERVLQRLLSGMHESVTIQVLANYYPPKKGEVAWRPNTDKFMATVGKHPEWLKNLNFAYLVMLRALHKAKPVLYNWEYTTGEPTEDENTSKLMKHLLDASEMKLCTPVFEGFDEDSLFPVDRSDRRQLAEQFKSVFQNVTTLTNCVRCRRCRLHSKVTLLGLGTGLKILLTPDVSLLPSALSRDEIVALVNTVHTFSHSLMEVGRLTNLYLEDQRKLVAQVSRPAAAFSNSGASAMELALSYVAELHLDQANEDLLVDAIVDRDEAVLSLAASFPPEAFGRHALRYLKSRQRTVKDTRPRYDAVVVGGGLAGMSAAIASADRGARVLLLDKSKHLGGNSAKASSGINMRMDQSGECYDSFLSDTIRSCESGLGPCGHPELANVLVNDSYDAVHWIEDRFGVPLSAPVKLGGHSRPRTVRPPGGLVGAELTAAGSKVIHKMSNIVVVNNAKLVGLIADHSGTHEAVRGVSILIPYDAINGPAKRHINMYKSRGLLQEVDYNTAVEMCAVFGKRIGDRLPVEKYHQPDEPVESDHPKRSKPTIDIAELAKHGTPNDCWIALYGSVYDFSGYSTEHPGGSSAIEGGCGRDATETFEQVHTANLVEDMGFEPIGNFFAEGKVGAGNRHAADEL
ncbi:fumarate reductase [Perkinsus chesapeaki]|uniref:Fumarate reductase n=1 Tax=Perkinsus chesapeaki TaxID=330153 RepID=A0A7J6N401_PERCH|nr:fumarate reductase [Perkinsus chesapeaki]